jgi:hypothetical protein
MAKRWRIPDEPRFVQAFALAVDPGDTLGLLIEIGAVGSPDTGIVRRTRKPWSPPTTGPATRRTGNKPTPWAFCARPWPSQTRRPASTSGLAVWSTPADCVRFS